MRWGLALALCTLASLSPLVLAADGAPAQPPRVTMFGDSVADSLQYVPEARRLLGNGLDLRLELTACRKLATPGCAYMGMHPISVLDIVEASPHVALGDVVIVDVGYNEPAEHYDEGMSQVVSALVRLGVAHVLWVTMREQTDNYRQIDEIIREEARRWPQVEVLDWDAASRGEDWFQPDGLHLNADGAFGLAEFLRPYVLAACGADCRSASAPPAELPKNLRPPRLRGAALVGRRVTCLPGTWTGTRPIVFSYRWLRNGSPVARAFRPTRVLRAGDADRLVACRVWAANVAGARAATAKAVRVRGG